MRMKLLPLALVAAIGVTGAAFAASMTAEGTIRSIDASGHAVTLSDGTVYYLPAGTDLSPFRAGEKVTIVWTMKGDRHEAGSIHAAKS